MTSRFEVSNLCLKLSSCCLLFPPLPLTSTFPSTIFFFRKQFLLKMLPIQSAFLLFIVCRIFLFALTVPNTVDPGYNDIGLYHTSYIEQKYSVVPINSSLLTIALHSSIRKALVYNDINIQSFL